MQAELIYNPCGGHVAVRSELKEAVSFLIGCGWNVSWQETSEPKEATKLARQAVKRGAKVVVAVGGDGTVNEVANGLFGSDAALGVLPAGTTNVWAMQMGIPTLNPILQSAKMANLVADIEERIARPLPVNHHRRVLLDAAKVLVEGHTVAVDAGMVLGRYFLSWAGIGMDAAIVESISQKDKKALGSWAFLLPALRTARRYSSTDICLNLDGKVTKACTRLIVVSNIQLYGGLFAIGAKARVNDCKLDVCVFKGDGFFTFVQHALKVLSHQHLKDPNIDYYQGSEIIIEADRVLPVHLDGEPFAKTPITIHTVPSALKVIIPKKPPVNLFIT